MVTQMMRHQQRSQRLRKARQMLRNVDQRDGEIPRRVQDRKPERTHQHHIARGRGAVLPKHDRPAQ